MSKEKTINADRQADFNIKHRLVGAGVLIFFGVLVLPWMLGPPDNSVGGQQAHAARQSALDEAANSQAIDFDSDFFEGEEAEETVYISKITPLDGQAGPSKSSNTAKTISEAPEKDSESKTKIVAPTEVVKTSEVKAAPEPKDTSPDAIVKSSVANTKKLAEDSDSPVKDTVQNVDAGKKLIADAKANDNSKVVAAAAISSIDVGWVVQVGLFSTTGYEARANKLVSELVGDGFKADSTVVETNRGKGMRVWLGPFAKRADASKEVERLKGATGKDGFVRVYP